MAKQRRCAVLPDHLIEEIFLRLPAKLVLQCRRLSRAWAATLCSDDFEDRYLRTANLHGGLRIFGVRNYLIGGSDHKLLAPLAGTVRFIKADGFPSLVTTLPPTVDKDEEEEEPPDDIIYPKPVTTQCRGLVILQAVPTRSKALRTEMYYVCNPSTGQMTALPHGRTTGYRGRMDWQERYASLGLGYDVRTRRHKVVRIYYHGTSAGCEVYVINSPTPGLWRPIVDKPTGWIHSWNTSVFAQGHVYWLAYRDPYPQRQEMRIISFSISQEKLRTVPPPFGMDNNEHLSLTELGGRLCLFYPYRWRCTEQYEIWLMSECESWDLHCRIDLAKVSPEVNRFMKFGASPLAIIDNGRRILLTGSDYPDQIWAYNPLNGDTESLLDSSGCLSNPPRAYALRLCQAAIYEESIASPGRQSCKDTILISSPSTQALSLVLKWLPLRTLGKLMCVCRSWRSIIQCQMSNLRIGRH